MRYFENYKTVNLNMLIESGMYSAQLLKAIKDGDDKALREPEVISKDKSQDIDFMGPIVYAFEKTHGTYIAYKACGENLQKNLEFAKDIIKEEPEIIVGTAASRDREFIVQVVTEKPEVIKYISSSLKADANFTAKLCELNIPEVTTFAAQECKMPDTIQEYPEFAANKDFMLGAIQQDVNSLEYASDELKNNYEFIKEACTQNKESIKYVSEHIEEFGAESLKGAQEVLKEQFNGQLEQDCTQEVERIKKEIEDKKQQGIEIDPKLEYRVKNLENRPQRIQARIAQIEEGDEKALRFARKALKNCNLNNEYREMLEQALKMGEAIAEKQKAAQEKVSDKDEVEITPQVIEEVANRNDQGLENIETETVTIRIEREAEIRIARESEIGIGKQQFTKEEIEVDDQRT